MICAESGNYCVRIDVVVLLPSRVLVKVRDKDGKEWRE